MKRSTINHHLKRTGEFLNNHNFVLPPWANWTLEDWRISKKDCNAVFQGGLGWDLTDFGSGAYGDRGLILFTLRNGNPMEPTKTYAEKIMMVDEGQETPRHFHWNKTEDIINRGGGDLIIELWNSGPDEECLDSPVTVMMDAIPRTVGAGEPIRMSPGMSITLTTGVYHRFYGAPTKGPVLVGEVSKVNDDNSDNRFFETIGRFPSIEEDEKPWRLLVGDYRVFLNAGEEKQP
ncbi:MAG: D-lyxose/D-mannose family sugar isomerase [Spirochaetaceae bacterium]|nr:D-lyxose/D-mannose family sugar isomerase [Spirochaetaceae bacterium]MDT8296962.1 D-lyxose/D-mannose family sugar isomerase [Spirochaetaceae bacterium]